MKNFRIVLISAIITVVLVLSNIGCSDVLEPKVYGELAPETFFSSESDFNQALIALYSPFSTDWGTNDPGDGVWSAALYNADPKSYFGQSMITTDELYAPYHPNFNNFTWGPATFTISAGGDVFAATFVKSRYIARATDVIHQIENSEADVQQEVKDRYIAEAMVLRAWLMYTIYDFHGPVPVKLDPETLFNTDIDPRPSKEDYINFIEQELNAAIPFLPPKYNSDENNWGRVSQGVAHMILLRLYMHEKEWQKAEQKANDIVGLGYSLLPNYANVFNLKRNNEIIYAVPSSESSPNYWTAEVIPSNYRSGISGISSPGWNVYYMPWSFYDNFEPQDNRLQTIANTYVNNRNATLTRQNGMPGAIPLKFTAFTSSNPGQGMSFDQTIFRFAEVLLSMAEAINEQRGPAEAYTYLNQVRERAGLAPISNLTQDEFRDELLLERGRELFGEGTRRMDLIRHGKFIENALNRGVTNAQPHHVLFPLPETVIVQGNGIIEQNPGY